jgi:hypothetical protein
VNKEFDLTGFENLSGLILLKELVNGSAAVLL